MRKFIVPILGIIIMMGLTQCHSNSEKKIVGVWQLKELVVNGTVLQGSSLGNWLWEFNEAGGYLTDVAGMREKGTYTLKDSILSLKLVTEKSQPKQVYKVARLDSVELDLIANDANNRQSLRFIKRKVSDVVGGDKD